MSRQSDLSKNGRWIMDANPANRLLTAEFCWRSVSSTFSAAGAPGCETATEAVLLRLALHGT